MAETVVPRGRLRETLRPYRAVLASRARSQRAYRTSFAIDLGGSMLVGLVELAEVWVLFSNVTSLGGMRFNQILLVFGLADLAFSLADLSFGHLDTLPDYLRAGTLDAFYLRPQHHDVRRPRPSGGGQADAQRGGPDRRPGQPAQREVTGDQL